MYKDELKEALEAAKIASKKILEIYHTNFNVEIKSDDSPVTEADKKADVLIRKHLGKAFPKYAFLTEESIDDGKRLLNDYVWIIDPLDGTSDFVNKDGEFTVNIALCYKHEIVVGVVAIPCSGDIYYASKGDGAFVIRNGISTKICVNKKLDDLTFLVSHFHNTEKVMDVAKRHQDKIKHIEKIGSSIKACLIAEGKAEIYLKFDDNTKEWDTAAFQLIVEEAGGVMQKHNGEKIIYNREDVYNRNGFIIANRKENLFE